MICKLFTRESSSIAYINKLCLLWDRTKLYRGPILKSRSFRTLSLRFLSSELAIRLYVEPLRSKHSDIEVRSGGKMFSIIITYALKPPADVLFNVKWLKNFTKSEAETEEICY